MTKKPTDLDVSAAIAALLASAGRVTAGALADALAVSRQAAHGHLRKAVDAGTLRRVGAGRSTAYVPPELRRRYAPGTVDEEGVWADVEAAIEEMSDLKGAARTRAHYAVTEVVNNAIDHADASVIDVTAAPAADEDDPSQRAWVRVVVADDGVGALARAREGLDVERDEEVIVELAKGKRTTAPERHSGEGLFFTSKAVKRFVLEAGGLAWIVDNRIADEGIAVSEVTRGTRVTLLFDPEDTRPLEEVFAPYTIDYAFAKTRTRIKLLDYGPSLISRSQAKRVVSRLEAFTEVELDFTGVRGVGQGFVDEVFRVWAREHPETTLTPTHMNRAVRFMVERGLPSPRR